jgi:hypothetical protein
MLENSINSFTEIFNPKITSSDLTEYLTNLKNFNPLEKYNINEDDFKEYIKNNYYNHLSPRDSDQIYDNFNKIKESFYKKRNDVGYPSDNIAIANNLIIELATTTLEGRSLLLKLVKDEQLTMEESKCYEFLGEAINTAEIEYFYGIPILTMKKNDFFKIHGISIKNMGIILTKGEYSLIVILRHEITHIIQGYVENKQQKNSVEKNKNAYESSCDAVALKRLKHEFEAYMTYYPSFEKFGGKNTVKSLIYAFLGLDIQTLVVNDNGEGILHDKNDKETFKKAKAIINMLENILPKASPNKLIEINNFIQKAKNLEEIIGNYDTDGNY